MKTTKLKNIALFHGEQLEFINSATVYITDGVISKISDSASTTNGLINGIDSDYVEIDGDGFILIPAFVNAGIFVNNGVVDENINEAELEFNDLISEALNTSLRTGTIAASIILQNEKLNLSHLSEWKQDMCISVLDCESVVESAYYGRKRLQANGNGVVKKTIAAQFRIPRQTVKSNISSRKSEIVVSGDILMNSPDLWKDLEIETRRSGDITEDKLRQILRSVTKYPAELMGISSRGIIERDLSADFIIVKLKPYWKRTAKAILYSMLIGGSSDIVHAVFKSGIPMYWDMNSSISNSMQSLSLSRYYTADPDHSISETAPHLNIELSPAFDTIEDALTEIGKGNFVIVVDNEDRENEGDLVLAAEDMTPEKMAFMIRYTSGVICVPAEGDRLDELELPLMVERNTESLRTAYTITVDYSIGTTTGISAYDRSLTVRKLADPKSTPNQFTRPGHVFPLRYAPGGVLKRVGHTEASVDFCKLAGKQPVAAISEIVLDDGRMARRDDLRVLAKRWGMKIVKISDLVKYRVEHGV